MDPKFRNRVFTCDEASRSISLFSSSPLSFIKTTHFFGACAPKSHWLITTHAHAPKSRGFWSQYTSVPNTGLFGQFWLVSVLAMLATSPQVQMDFHLVYGKHWFVLNEAFLIITCGDIRILHVGHFPEFLLTF